MKLHCDATGLQMPVLTDDTLKAAQTVRDEMATGSRYSHPWLERDLGVLLELLKDPHKVTVSACAWDGVIDDVDWKPLGRNWFLWTCPRCGTRHEWDNQS